MKKKEKEKHALCTTETWWKVKNSAYAEYGKRENQQPTLKLKVVILFSLKEISQLSGEGKAGSVHRTLRKSHLQKFFFFFSFLFFFFFLFLYVWEVGDTKKEQCQNELISLARDHYVCHVLVLVFDKYSLFVCYSYSCL